MNPSRFCFDKSPHIAYLLLLAIAILASGCLVKVNNAKVTDVVVPTATSVPTPRPAPTSTPVPTPTTPPLTLEALKNAEYQSEFAASGKVQLVNGTYREKVTTGYGGETVISLSDKAAFGDLNGDSKIDAAVVLIASSGGSGTFYTLAAIANQAGKPKHVASSSLGDRVQIKSLSIQTGTITVDMVKHGPNDPLCCPTLQATQKYRLQGDKLVKAD